jgi:hypothetical protein
MFFSPWIFWLKFFWSGNFFERRQNMFRVRYPAENAALFLDHLQSRFVHVGKVGTDAIFGHEAVVAAIVGFANGSVHANFRGHAGDDELLNAAILHDGVQVGRVERAFAGLVNHRFAVGWIKFGNDVVSGFAPNQNSSHRAGIADGGRAATANFFRGRQTAEIGTVSFARVQNLQTFCAPRGEQNFVRLNRAAQL